MKIGRETNSVMNLVMSGTSGQPSPEVGMGVTELHWTDRHAGTVTWVSKTGKTLRYRLDIAKRVDDNGMSESQTYEYEPDPTAAERTARQNRRTGAWKMTGGPRLSLGVRRAYHDYSF